MILPWAIDADIEKGRILPAESWRFMNVQREAETVAAVMTTHFTPIEHYRTYRREILFKILMAQSFQAWRICS